MDRDAIERRDFPLGRRGYDTTAVDAHLRRVADEMELLRLRTATPPRPRGVLSAGASDRVREILEAAEHSAAQIREAAGRDAGAHVTRVGEATAAMLSRLDQLQRELDALVDGLRRAGERLEDGLERLRDDVRELGGGEDEPDDWEPVVEDESDREEWEPATGDEWEEAPPAPPEPDAIPEPPVAPAIDEPADPAAFAPDDESGTDAGDDEAGARLIALNMALGGTPREEAARFLAEHYDLRDPEALLDDVYSRVPPPGS